MELKSVRIISSSSSLNSYLQENFENLFNGSNRSQKFVEFQIDGELELLSVDNALRILEHFSTSSFVLRVSSTTSNSDAFYWRLKDVRQIFMLRCKANFYLCEFLKQFLITEIEKGKNGAIPGVKSEAHQLINPIDMYLIGDERGFNILFLAAEAGNAKIVQSLLEDGMNVSCLVDGKIPADIAYEKKHLDALLCLLKANSRYPRDFKMQEENPEDLKLFIKESFKFRDAVVSQNREIIEAILNSNKSLRYFYDTNNESILTYALVNKKFEMYELLMSFHLSFGPREDFEETMNFLSLQDQKKLKLLHQKSSRKVMDKHLMILMSNSFIAHDNFVSREKLNYVYEAYEYLNRIPIAKPILKAVAARRDFEIHFDFNRDSVVYLDPFESGSNGLFYFNGRILISAKGLLDPSTRNEVYGVLIHELTHFAMALVYKNWAKPYDHRSSNIEETFSHVVELCKSKMEHDPIVESVFLDYEKEAHHVELIVRSPHLIAHYHEDQEKLAEIRELFAPLHRFFEDQVVPDVEEAIQRIENEAEEAYNKALKKISRLKKALWFLGIFSIFFSAILALILYNPTLTWKGLNPSERTLILNAPVNYRGINVTLKHLMANDSEGFEFLHSDHIKDALEGNLKSLNHALNTNLDQYIFLSPSNLTGEFWDKILHSNVNFQGQNVSLGDVASNNSALVQLLSNQIKSLLSNESIDIGKKIEFTSFYIPRKFIATETLNSSSEVFDYARAMKIFLLADKPGSGKSITFQALQKYFKEIGPDYWIEFIELKNFIGVFRSLKGYSVDIIADRILNLKGLERDIFVDRFENGKVILLWDAIDEITPDYDDNFLSIAFDIFSIANNTQFLSTRPQNADKLKGRFRKDTHSLVEYTKEDRNNFINGFLNSDEKYKHHRSRIYEQVVNFTDKILSKATDKLKQDINNPLMLKMLIEIANKFELSTNLDDTFKVYDKFVELELNDVSKKGVIVTGIALNTARNVGIDKIHMVHALKYILADSFDNHLNNTQTLTDTLWSIKVDHLTDDQLSSYGIMTRSNNKTDFVHRTFAEFFVAKYLISSIYEYDHLRPKDWSSVVSLLNYIAYDTNIRKVIQDFIYSFLRTQENIDRKEFEGKIIEAIKFETLRDYFFIEEKAPLFIKFFEKDERVMKILTKVDQYENINDWLHEVLGISLGNKKSFIENNQLGLILMRAWQFERKDKKVFADFVRKSTKILDNTSSYRNITELSNRFSGAKSIVEFLNIASETLKPQEMKEIFINSLHVFDNEFEDPEESSYFFDQFKKTLNLHEVKTALTKFDKDDESLCFKSVRIENEKLNNIIFALIERSLSDPEIFELFTRPDKIHNGTLLMNAVQWQSNKFISKLLDFTLIHTTLDQFRSILLQADKENDTMLQYAQYFPFPENFEFLVKIYKILISDEEVRLTYLNRKKPKLPSFAESFRASTSALHITIANFLRDLFKDHQEELLEFITRRNENGDTVFSLYKDNKLHEKRLKPYVELLNELIRTRKDKDILIEEIFTRI